MTVFILGGGPAALGLAEGLTATRQQFVLLERQRHLGGLATTLRWEDHGAHDLGPHKLFTKDDLLMRRVEALLPADAWLTQDKRSSIYMGGHYLPYPPSPFSLAKVYGWPAFAQMTAGYAAAMTGSLRRLPPARTFEHDLQRRIGDPLYQAVLRPIALKLWGNPRRLDVKLSQGRVQTPSPVEIARTLLGAKKKSGFEALTFRYPKGGLQRLWEAIERRASGRGQFILGAEIDAIVVEGDRVRRLDVLHQGRRKTFAVQPDDFVMSTIPLQALGRLMGTALDRASVETIDEVVVLNTLLLVFIKLRRQRLLSDSWVFVPDPDVPFHRVSEQASFDPAMTPNGTIVCCEIMDNELRPMAGKSDAELQTLALTGLAHMGFDVAPVAMRVVRLRHSYPVFRPGFEARLEAVLEQLDHIRNYRSVGRQGAFNYIGTLDALDIGFGAARWLEQGQDRAAWSAERLRTRHYPVLD